MRNPLYLGNGLMCLALSLMAGWQWALLTAVFFYVIYILVIIPSEEVFLLEKFSGEYAAYMNDTPAIIPNLKNLAKNIRAGDNIKWNAEQAWFMERHSLYMNAAVICLLLARMAWRV
ncbi:hypothetical protein FACS1894216_17130 [Synergistales bacterium]|nr:hypothetical protein FACS1894216_17130 [Synergistales bacterium]